MLKFENLVTVLLALERIDLLDQILMELSSDFR